MPRDADIRITFSEGMDPRATGDAVALAPRVEIAQRRWRRNTLVVHLADTLERDQTYTVFVGTGARDRHGNVLVEGAAITFSTADVFPAGAMSGELRARGMSAAGIYLWCYEARPDREPDSTARDFDALALADRDGRFQLSGLHVPQDYRLWAFADLNKNRSFEPNIDVLAPVDTVFRLTAEAPGAHNLVIEVVNPHAPAVIRGAVLDSLPDSLGVLRVTAVSDSDSTLRVMTSVEDGVFELSVDAGVWWLQGFRDLNKNRRLDPETEPASEPRKLDLPPAEILENLELVLQAAKGAAEP